MILRRVCGVVALVAAVLAAVATGPVFGLTTVALLEVGVGAAGLGLLL
jgi:hypothetical protein